MKFEIEARKLKSTEVETISDDSLVEVAVISFSGRLGTFSARRGHSVSELKEMIKVTTGIPADHQVLKFGRHFLPDPHEKPLTTLYERSTASLFVHMVEGFSSLPRMIEVKVLGMAGNLGMFEACRFSTVAELRSMIERSTQIAGRLQLFINDELLCDPLDQPLALLDSTEATVFVVGTQGPVVQDIYKYRQDCDAILARLTGRPG
eukprot:gnl/TRDRNA2_/TRDRNA2_184824_c0_seq1.p1 gnl/TRDRNA2_/TRDRNA2_184824_c0~~gnl/TRDRNA2_/TRDRNA2_184824_c0_seq1.p1  ORF type:complete len:206 (+),score=25.80 gnl/TRDRNA2_/TRDRNA2_184824_c0_seq1:152-769(+)